MTRVVEDVSAAGARTRLSAVAVAVLAHVLVLAFVQPAFAETLVGSGFESGADGVGVAAPWIAVGGPQRAEYDSARARVGSMSGWVVGPTSASYAGIGEQASSGMTSTGAENRFWMYFDTTNQFRVVDDWAPAVADRAFSIQFSSNGQVYAYTNRPGSPNGYTSDGYTSVGTYAVGWTEFRIVYDFASQTYTLSKRSDSADPWTPMKASAASSSAIPFRGANQIVATHGTLYRAYTNTNLWLDQPRFSDSGIVDVDMVAPTAPAALVAGDVPNDEGRAVALSWTAATDNVAVTGYRVYRGTAPGAYGSPVTVFGTTTYVDQTVSPGSRYYYRVAAIDAAGNEGSRSPEAWVLPTDEKAPAAPTGVAATGGVKSVSLGWSAGPEPDLTGYNVYRSGVRVNPTIVRTASYVDAGLIDGTSYVYAITAVDSSGNESIASVTATGTTVGVAPYEPGFESGTDGIPVPAPWTAVGTPQRAEYDDARAKNGLKSLWITGPTGVTYAGLGERSSAGMSATGAENRFWLYFDTTNQFRVIDDWAPTTADRAFSIQFADNGQIYAFTNRPGNPNGYTSDNYTAVGAYSTGWTEFRIVYDFPTQSYTLSKRTGPTDPWTALKAAGAADARIPFRGSNTVTATHGVLYRAYTNANLWVDQARYSNSAITSDEAEFSVTASAQIGGQVTPKGSVNVAMGSSSPEYAITPEFGKVVSAVYIDGVSVGAVTRYRFLSVAAPHTLVATFKDKPGTTDMPVQNVDCDTCHTPPHPDDWGACGDCHDMSAYHQGSAAGMHVTAAIGVCATCHDARITVEHNGRVTSSGSDIGCPTCHNSTDPKVVNAIAARDSSCVSCHGAVQHGAPPTGEMPVGACQGCHEASEHDMCSCGSCHSTPSSMAGNWGAEFDYGMSSLQSPKPGTPLGQCSQYYCHVMGQGDVHGADRITSVINRGWTCQTCHSASYPAIPRHAATHASSLASECAGCHAGTLTVEHNRPGLSCAVCHGAAAAPAVKAAVKAGDTSCSACHDPATRHQGIR